MQFGLSQDVERSLQRGEIAFGATAAGLPYLHQAMIANGHPAGLHVTLMDGDAISPSNCVRQPFSRSEIGLYKAVVLVNRDYSSVDYWLDVGNNADSGQFVLGEPLNEVNRRSRTRLRTVAELFPLCFAKNKRVLD